MPHRQQSRLKAALLADLLRANMSQEDLARRMGDLSQQAISKWVQQGHIPEGRIPQLKEVLGPDSEVVRVALTESRSDHIEAGFTYDLSPMTPLKAREGEPERPNLREHTMHARMRELLPEHLKQHVDVRVRIGGSDREVDYFSENVVLELKALTLPRAIMNAASRAAMQLQLVKALQPDGRSTRKFVIALVLTEGVLSAQYLDAVQKLTAEMALLGIVLLVTPNIEAVVGYIVATEDAASGNAPQDLFDE